MALLHDYIPSIYSPSVIILHIPSICSPLSLSSFSNDHPSSHLSIIILISIHLLISLSSNSIYHPSLSHHALYTIHLLTALIILNIISIYSPLIICYILYLSIYSNLIILYIQSIYSPPHQKFPHIKLSIYSLL